MAKSRSVSFVHIPVILAVLLAALPVPARAWKVDTHVYAANLVLEEALSTLTFQEIDRHRRRAQGEDQGRAAARLRQLGRRHDAHRLPGQRVHPVGLLPAAGPAVRASGR